MSKCISDFDKRMGIPPVNTEHIVFHQITKAPFELTGFPWFGKEKLFRRLPVSPEEKIPEGVDFLANCTAGGKIRFSTNSKRILIRGKRGDFDFTDTMTYAARGGFDIYEGEPGREHFLSVMRANPANSEFVCNLADFPDSSWRTFTVYFPLYKGIITVEIGLEKDAQTEAPPPLQNPPIAVYGTSITQGGCASRPGMCYTNILSRRLHRHILNFGFSGSGRGEPEVARILASLPDVSLYLLDFEPNVGDRYAELLPPFIREIRKRKPSAPILVLTRYRFTKFPIPENQVENNRKAVEGMHDPRLFFMNGTEILGPDGSECLIDGIHATDMAFYRMADALQPELEKILKTEQENR